MSPVRFVGPTGPAPLDPGPNGYARALADAQDGQSQALAQAIADIGRTPPRSPAALAEDLAAQALLQYAGSHVMPGRAPDASGGAAYGGGPLAPQPASPPVDPALLARMLSGGRSASTYD